MNSDKSLREFQRKNDGEKMTTTTTQQFCEFSELVDSIEASWANPVETTILSEW